MFDSDAGSDQIGLEPRSFAVSRDIDLTALHWHLDISGKEGFISRSDQLLPWVILGGGLSASLLLFGLMYSLATSQTRATELARHMTSDLRQSKAKVQESEERLRILNAELEQRVQERTQMLETANRDLQSFSYSVSHDLRSPLRQIGGFAALLKRDYFDKLEDTGREQLGRIVSATSRMSRLVDGLLELARLSANPITRRSVDLSLLAEEVLADLRQNEPEREVAVEIGRGLHDQGDPILLRSVLENLLSNAWKYTARQQSPSIQLGRISQDGSAVYFVRDNGVGFDMQYADKLFHALKRLHRVDEFAGTGIGLATAQRIIAAHGGRIWAESEPDRGATFFFTLGSATSNETTPSY